MSHHHQHSLRLRLFFLMRRDDVELAETFLNLCPDTDRVEDLNKFFCLVFSQYNMDTAQQRALLDNTLTPNEWLNCFMTQLFPVLREQRFPPNTQKTTAHFYAASQ